MKKYKVVKGADGKYKLTKNDVKPLNVIRPIVDIANEAIDEKIKNIKKE